MTRTISSRRLFNLARHVEEAAWFHGKGFIEHKLLSPRLMLQMPWTHHGVRSLSVPSKTP